MNFQEWLEDRTLAGMAQIMDQDERQLEVERSINALNNVEFAERISQYLTENK